MNILRSKLRQCLTLLLLAFAVSPAMAQTSTTTLAPIADAYVRDGATATTNYGSATALNVKLNSSAGANRRAFLSFDLSHVTGVVSAATLRLYGSNLGAGYSGTDSVHAVTGAWTESGITWNTQPAYGASLSTATITSTAQYCQWDVTSYIQSQRAGGQTNASLAVVMDNLPATNQNDAFNSREASSNPPQLVLTIVPPAAPINVTATAGNFQVTLTWSPVAGATGYKVYRSVAPGAEGTTAYVKNVTSPYVDGFAQNGTTYYYQVTAYDSAGESPHSAEVTATPLPPAPAAPAGLTATPSNLRIGLSWSAATLATSYNVKRSTSSGGPYTTIATLSQTSQHPALTSYTDTAVSFGTTYYYVVSALDLGGESPNSTEVQAAPLAALPAPPTNLTSVAGDGLVSLAWTASPDAVTYNVYRGSHTGGPYDLLASGVLAGGNIYTDTDVINANHYYYVLTAVNAVGESAYSNETTSFPTGSVSISPVADAYVRDGTYANTNYGTDTSIYVKANDAAGANRRAYFKFDLTQIHGLVDNARVQLYGANQGTPYLGVDSIYAVSDTTWVEKSITWSNAPAIGAHLSSANVTGTPATVQFDVTSYIQSALADGKTSVSLAVTMDGVPSTTRPDQFTTRENKANRPHLVVSVTPLVNEGINFQPSTSTVPSGFTPDTGGAFNFSSNFGWITEDSVTSGGGRPVDKTADTVDEQRPGIVPQLNTYVAMQPAGGVSGAWQAALPNGFYNVTVSVGSGPNSSGVYDSSNTINLNGANLINAFVGSAAQEYMQATQVVQVTNGVLVVDAIGGHNTKIDYLTITNQGVPQFSNPSIGSCLPADGATGVFLDGAVFANMELPNLGYGLDLNTATNATIQLIRNSDGVVIPGYINSDAAGDTLTYQPTALLDPNTTYTFVLGSGVKDLAGMSFIPFTSTFTTGTATSIPMVPGVGFQRSVVYQGSGATCVVIGPDHKLYASNLDGTINRWTINPDGSLSNIETYSGLVGRVPICLTFDPTHPNVIWLTNDAPLYPRPCPDFSGKITKLLLSGSGFNGTLQDYVVGLPRSGKDHLTNSLAFGPDGKLYVCQGANTAEGAPDPIWYNRPERLLSSSILQIDPTITTNLPINVQTEDYNGTLGSYNPYAANAPVRLYADGLRNPYDLVFHSNGNLYIPTNGSSSGGNTPASPAGVTPIVPAIINGPLESDYCYRVVQGGYYGHPNPLRHEYVLDGGNPTPGVDPAEVVNSGDNPGYPVGVLPDANWRGYSWDMGFDRSPDGAIEYKSNTFGGALQHKVLVAQYSVGKNIVALTVGSNSEISKEELVYQGLNNPVDLIEDTTNGNLYVSELISTTGQISLLRPQATTISVSPRQLYFNQAVNAGPTAAQLVTITNAGLSNLTVSGATLTGAAAAQFSTPGAPTFPATIASGGYITIPVAFTPTTVGAVAAQLQIQSNDLANPTVTVQLGGVGSVGVGGVKEPTLQSILDLYGIPINVGSPNPSSDGSPVGDEIIVQRFQKAGPGNVTIQPIAVFGPQDTPSGLVCSAGYYGAGQATPLTQLFTVPNASYQTVNVQVNGNLSFDPGTARFGFYSLWPYWGNRTIYQEDQLNTYPGALPHQVRIYQMKDPNGVPEANAYLVAFEENNTKTDYNDLVFIVRNVMPATGVISTTNLDGYPTNLRMVFNRIGSLANPPPDVVHNSATLRVTNTGLDPVQVTGLPISGYWTLASQITLPVTLAPAGSLDVPISFISQGEGGGLQSGVLNVQTNAPDQPSVPVTLAGLWQPISEGGTEPPIDAILNQTFGYGTKILYPGQTTVNYGHVSTIGEEILSGYWTAADPTQSVSVKQLAAYHTFLKNAPIAWFPQGNVAAASVILTTAGVEAQSLLPHLLGSPTIPSYGTFSPSGPFGLKVDTEFSDDSLNETQYDIGFGGVLPVGHHMRFWPLRDAQGYQVPNAYLMGMDYNSSTSNYDFQDNLYIITNIKPIQEDRTVYVNPFIGTGAGVSVIGGSSSGNTFPGAEAPFGAVQLSPDTDGGATGGYSYAGTKITGFSHAHFSGAGGAAYGDISFLPTTGSVTTSDPTQYASTFAHTAETAQPGYYSVSLPTYNVTAELTATTHVGWHRYTFPAGAQANVLVNLASDLRGPVASATERIINGNMIEGSVTGYPFYGNSAGLNPVTYTVYFSAKFDHNFIGGGTWTGSTITPGSVQAFGPGIGGYVTFDTSTNPVVTCKVGISYTSLAEARANIISEAPAFSFDGAAQATKAAWNNLLHTVDIAGGTTDQRTVFYTALYHSLQHPNIASDVDGSYLGFDQTVHNAGARNQYMNFSLWDTSRTQTQLLDLVAPSQEKDILSSIMSIYNEAGWLPRWTYANVETGTMLGDPVQLTLADGYLKGLLGSLDPAAVYAAMLNNANQLPPANSEFAGRIGLSNYLANGYVPYVPGATGANQKLVYGASLTSAYSMADAALAEVAAGQGDSATASQLIVRAQNYHSLFDPGTLLLRPRLTDGSSLTPFVPTSQTGWKEGTSWQYTWENAQDFHGLMGLMGGMQSTANQLDQFFAYNQLLTNPTSVVTTQWGGGANYNPYNENDLNAPYLYAYVAQPWKVNTVVRAAESLFTNSPTGIPGNDDLGAMSAWFVLSSMGVYPVTPGADWYVLTSPLFQNVTVNLDPTVYQTPSLTIAAPGANSTNQYITKATLNGVDLNKAWIKHSDIQAGAKLSFTLGTSPSSSWATDAGSLPPTITP